MREDFVRFVFVECIKNNKMFNILNSGLEGAGHYFHSHPRDKYEIPDDFDLDGLT